MVLVWGKYSSDTDLSYIRAVVYIINRYHSPNYISDYTELTVNCKYVYR